MGDKHIWVGFDRHMGAGVRLSDVFVRIGRRMVVEGEQRLCSNSP